MKGIIPFFISAVLVGVFFTGELACQEPDEGSGKYGPYTSSPEPKQDPAVKKKLDEILRAIKDLKDELAKVKEELNIIKIRVTK